MVLVGLPQRSVVHGVSAGFLDRLLLCGMVQMDLSRDDLTALLIGRIVLACARLEFEVKVVCGQLAGWPTDSKPMSQRDQFRQIRRLSALRSDAQQFREWAIESNSILGARADLVHGSYMEIIESEGGRTAFIAHKKIQEVDIDDERLETIRTRSNAAVAIGNRLSKTLFDEMVTQQPSPPLG